MSAIIIPTFIILSEIDGKHILIGFNVDLIWTTDLKTNFSNEHKTNVNKTKRVSSRAFGTISQPIQRSAMDSRISSGM